MKQHVVFFFLVLLLIAAKDALGQNLQRDIPYVTGGHPRQKLDVYTPEDQPTAKLPVIF